MLLLLLLLLLLLALSAITSTLPYRISIFNAYLLRCRGLERKRDVNTMKITLDRSKISLTLRTMQTDSAYYTLRGSNHSILAFTIDRLPSMASTFADEIERKYLHHTSLDSRQQVLFAQAEFFFSGL